MTVTVVREPTPWILKNEVLVYELPQQLSVFWRTYNGGHLHIPVYKVLSLVRDGRRDNLALSLLIPVLIPGRDDAALGGLIDRVELVQLRLDEVGPHILVDDLGSVLAEEQNLVGLENPTRGPNSAVVLLGQGDITGKGESCLGPRNSHGAAGGNGGQEGGNNDSGMHFDLSRGAGTGGNERSDD